MKFLKNANKTKPFFFQNFITSVLIDRLSIAWKMPQKDPKEKPKVYHFEQQYSNHFIIKYTCIY